METDFSNVSRIHQLTYKWLVNRRIRRHTALNTLKDFQVTVKLYKDKEEKHKKLLDTIGYIRLATFLIGVAVVSWLYFQDLNRSGTLALGLFLLVFIGLVMKYSQVKSELIRIRSRIKVNQMFIDRINGQWTNFTDSGMDFENSKHPYSSDLDIFGRNSLFQWINVGNTYYGRTILKEYLATSEKNSTIIHKRQEAVKELATKTSFTEELQCEGMIAERISQHPEALIGPIEIVQAQSISNGVRAIFYVLPAITIASIVAVLLGLPISPYIPLAMLTMQIILTAIGFIKAASTLGAVYLFKDSFAAYRNFIQLVEKEPFQSPYMIELKGKLYEKGVPVSKQLDDLEKVNTAIDMRNSALLYFLLNALFLWDYHCIFALEKWQRKHGKNVRKWLETIGTIEALSSLSVTARINTDWSYPEFMDRGLEISCKQLGHPLITADKRVSNDITVKNNLGIITGSNMSGKTTMLRTIGINLVLAYAGAPVCAKEMRCSMMDIFTSMRITDDLNSGISSFYAELLRIKTIIEFSKEQKPMLFLIDEIFRGTNSKDRIIGAKSVLKNLSKEWVIGLISTHDFELCDLEREKGTRIINYHFTEHYINNEIKFDYVLRTGRCQTTNARYLMKMVGIELDEVT